MSRDRMERVSVALCTWNGEPYIADQLDSIAGQTVPPQQVVVVDDASSDHTWERLQVCADRLRAHGIEVLLHRQAVNVGYVRNFETALRLCQGDIVFLCDQDDVWLPTKVARFLDAFAQRPHLAMLHSDARLVDADGGPMGRTLFQALGIGRRELDREHAGQGFEILMGRNIVTGAASALCRDLVDRALPVPPGWIHDEWLALVAAAEGGLDSIEEPTIDYRQHDSNQVGARRRGMVQRIAGDADSRTAYMDKMLVRLQTLQVRAAQGSPVLGPAQRETVEQRLLHARARAALPRSLSRRLWHVVEEVRSGRYARFSSGWKSIASDLLRLRRST